MERSKLYRFCPHSEIKELFGKKSKERLLAMEYYGGIVLKIFNDDEVLIAPLRSRKRRPFRLSESYCIRIEAADRELVVDCRLLHRIRAMALLETVCYERDIPHMIRERVYREFEAAKQHRSALHERLHKLKREIEIGKMNNIPQDRQRDLEEQFNSIAYELGYREKEVMRERLAPLKTYNRKPLPGGRFSPR